MRFNFIKLLFLILPLTLLADVFWRVPRRATSVLSSLGGAEAYRSAIEVNGKAGTLSSYIFKETADVVSYRLARKLKLPQPKSASTIMLDASNKTLCKYIVIKAPDLDNRCIVTSIEQNLRVFRRAGSKPPPWPDKIPVFNATAEFSAACHKTGTTFLCAKSRCSSTRAAVDEAAAALIQAGWKAVIPATPDFMIFTKKNQQSLVFSSEKPASHQIMINILRRDGSKQ